MVGQLEQTCDFGALTVTIEAVDATTVTFSTRSASKSGDPDECLLRSFTVPLAEVHAAAIAGAPEPVPMKAGATGNLFLSSVGWQNTRSSDGFAIYGVERAVFKWPSCAAAPSHVLSRLTVVPTSIALHGHLEGGTEFFELELLGPDASETQSVVWNGAHLIELRLTPSAAERVGLPAGVTVARVWPTRIEIHGAPMIDPVVYGAVNLLDLELASEVQHLTYDRHGGPITLSLTQDGVNAFHVTPQAVAEVAELAGAAAHASPSRAGSPQA